MSKGRKCLEAEVDDSWQEDWVGKRRGRSHIREFVALNSARCKLSVATESQTSGAVELQELSEPIRLKIDILNSAFDWKDCVFFF